MYCIEGLITTRTKPETLIGQHGLYYTDIAHDILGEKERTFTCVGSPELVLRARARFAIEEGMRLDAPIEVIKDTQTAEKYAPPEDERVGLESAIEPNAIEVVTSRVPDNRELLLADIALWQEVRKPFSTRYRSAAGTLLGLFKFDKEVGWYIPYDEVEGTRTVKGKVTPHRHDITISSNIEGKNRGYGATYPRISRTENTEQCRGPNGRFLNITKDLRKS